MQVVRYRMFLIVLVALSSFSLGCKKKQTSSRNKEFENSEDICKAIDTFAKQKHEDPAEQERNISDIFNEKKQSEKLILQNLISEYQGRVVALEKAEGASSNSKNQPSEGENGSGSADSSGGSNQQDGSSNSGSTDSSTNGVSDGASEGSSDGASGSTNLTDENEQNEPRRRTRGANRFEPADESLMESDIQSINAPDFQGIMAVCKEYRTSQDQEFRGIPPVPSEISAAAEARSVVKRYCNQWGRLNSDTCQSSTSQTVLCNSLGKDKPQWVSDSCEVATTAAFTTLQQAALETCLHLAKTSGSKGCGFELLVGVCVAHEKGLKAVLKNFNDLDGTETSDAVAIETTILSVFTNNALFCLQSAGKKAIKESIQAGGKPGFWASAVLGGQDKVDELIKGGLKTAQKKGFIGKVGKIAPTVAAAVCSAAANSVANTITQVPPREYESACGPRSADEAQGRVGSCFRTVASLCKAYTGTVDFGAIVGETSGGAAVTVGALSAAASVGCSFGGRTSEVACGLISSAAAQIKKAILTGNNDWADCTGTAKMGACIGEKLGQGGWSNDSPISTARTDGNGQTTKRCCRCDKVSYQSVFGPDQPTGTRQKISLIQDGDFYTGNCNRPGGKPQNSIFWESDTSYYQYEKCGPVIVAGDKCIDSAEIKVRTQFKPGARGSSIISGP